MKYFIYGAEDKHGSYKTILINENHEFPVEDYFLPTDTNIERLGTVYISGDTHYLPEHFINK